jgi:hypothetical protein
LAKADKADAVKKRKNKRAARFCARFQSSIKIPSLAFTFAASDFYSLVYRFSQVRQDDENRRSV